MNLTTKSLIAVVFSGILGGCSSLHSMNDQQHTITITAPTQLDLLLTRCTTGTTKYSVIPNDNIQCSNGICQAQFVVLPQDVFGCNHRFK